MNVIETDRRELAAKLVAAGVPATTDPSTLPPFVLVAPPTLLPGTALGVWELAHLVKIVHPAPGDVTAQEWMTDQLELIAGTVRIDRADPATETVGDDRLPAYLVEITRTIVNPFC